MSTHFMAGIPVQQINRVTDMGRYNISYDPRSSGYGCPTTALVLDDHVFFVLRGDHEKPMQAAALGGGVAGALRYFIANIGEAHEYSEHKYISPAVEDRFGLRPTMLEVLGAEGFAALLAAMEVPE